MRHFEQSTQQRGWYPTSAASLLHEDNCIKLPSEAVPG